MQQERLCQGDVLELCQVDALVGRVDVGVFAVLGAPEHELGGRGLIAANVVSSGMEPPLPMTSVSLPNTSVIEARAAVMIGPSGDVLQPGQTELGVTEASTPQGTTDAGDR